MALTLRASPSACRPPLQLSTKCYVDKVQRVLKRFVEAQIGRPVLAPHPDDHVGVFPTVDTKVSPSSALIQGLRRLTICPRL